ncbi:LOW QUALITY PROTEIN: hypothetical protein RvY_15598 [Ramazzottius varieornatus]|uniref:Uncharacterized protein n=1 Tax=Ramazzottius varieornatus TaxID=947166 RepID=A0A1D1W039_RAMVA|nr:LOW QUALITY PROTEIN: hypothetical protein RvY_15598 [Ramazzottius varieornatus]
MWQRGKQQDEGSTKRLLSTGFLGSGMSISWLFRQQGYGCSALTFRSPPPVAGFKRETCDKFYGKKLRKGDAPGRVQISQILGKRDST